MADHGNGLEIHLYRRERLAYFIVQLPRDSAALRFLYIHQPAG